MGSKFHEIGKTPLDNGAKILNNDGERSVISKSERASVSCRCLYKGSRLPTKGAIAASGAAVDSQAICDFTCLGVGDFDPLNTIRLIRLVR